MRKIAVEEHFVTSRALDTLRSIMTGEYHDKDTVARERYLDHEDQWDPVSRVTLDTTGFVAGKLLDLGEGRIADMDDAGIDAQILSHVSPGIQAFNDEDGAAAARECNDLVAAAVEQNPGRLYGLATIAVQSPKEAGKELNRAVTELGLKGALINSHTRGEYLDDEKFWDILETAESLDVPIYLHPRCPAPEVMDRYSVYSAVGTAMLGFTHEVSLHAMRMICAGVFDRFPGLKVMLGHLGESLPFWQWRIDNNWARQPYAKDRHKVPSQYLKDNFYITTSGIFSDAALVNAVATMGADSILFAVDYPFENAVEGSRFIESAPISDEDREKICHLNAERIFKL
ncbi:MAG: amidohydrolase [Thermoleophilia bacterium]|nr:amidohydrolase [Thermoleophilia bacterium]